MADIELYSFAQQQLNGKWFFTQHHSFLVNAFGTYWHAATESHFMYWQAGHQRWAISPLYDLNGANLLCLAQQGDTPAIAHEETFDCSQWVEFIYGAYCRTYGGTREPVASTQMQVSTSTASGHVCEQMLTGEVAQCSAMASSLPQTRATTTDIIRRSIEPHGVVAMVARHKTVLGNLQSSGSELREALQGLRELGALSTEVLSETGIGKVANRLGKTSSDENVRREAKDLVETWRSGFRENLKKQNVDMIFAQKQKKKRKMQQQMEATSKKRKIMSARISTPSKMPVVNFCSCTGSPPPPDKIDLFLGFLSARQLVAKNRARGLVGPAVYEEVDGKYAELLKAKVCPNIQRRLDRTTCDLHRFAAATQRLSLCSSVVEREHLKRGFVLNFAIWRVIGGTLACARAIGFLTDWGPQQRQHVVDVVRRAQEKGCVKHLFSNAYSSTSKIRGILRPNATEQMIEATLYNTGPKAQTISTQIVNLTLEGKLLLMDAIWKIAPEVVQAAAPDPRTGQTRWQPVLNILGKVFNFGTIERGKRVPTFFAKEIGQDLLDTPVFEGGRRAVSDLKTFSPAGPGALGGLQILYGLTSPPSQAEAMAMMRSLFDLVEKYHRGDEDLELHDIQFLLCEFKKFFGGSSKLRNYTGRLPQLCDEHFLFAPCLELLEEFIMLTTAKVQDAEFSDECVIQGVSTWLGLPQPMLPTSKHIAHGDLVYFKVLKSGHILHTEKRPKASPLQATDSLPKNESHTLLLERLSCKGPVCFGEELYFRNLDGMHLGIDPQQRIAALESERYGPEQRFSLESGKNEYMKPGCPVPWGAHVRLRHCGTFAPGYLQIISDTSVKSAHGQVLVVEQDAMLVRNVMRVHELLKSTIEQALSDGILRRGAHGQLEITRSAAVRQRLIGAASHA